MDIAVDVLGLEAQAMEVQNKKLAAKIEAFRNETDNAKKSSLADELTGMIEGHIKFMRESKIVQSFSGSDRDAIESAISHLEDMVALLKFEKASIDFLDRILGDFNELS